MAFKIATAFVGVTANDDGLRESLKAKVDAAGADLAFNLGIDLHDDGLRDKVAEAVFAAERGINAIVGIDLDNIDLRQQVIDATAEAERGISAIVGINLDNVDLRDQVIEATAEAERGINAIVGIDVDDDGLRDKVKLAADGARTSVTVDVDTNSAQSNVGALTGRVLALGAAAAIVGPALAAIPAVLAGGLGAVGTLALGFGSAGKALHDYGQESQSAGQSQQSLAASAFSAAVAIRGAQQSVTDAQTQAARSAVTSAEQIENAQRAVGDAERSAAIAAQSASDAIVAAHQRATDAAYNQQQAEQALAAAQQDAANQLVDSRNAAADASLAVERAQAAATAAQKNLDAANATGTTDQKATADLAAREAVQALADAKQRQVEADQKANAAQKAGVDQAPAVLSAQHQLAQAVRGVADAQASVDKATAAAAQQQINSDEQVAQARQRLADVQRSADQQRVDSTQRVERAEQSLADTIHQQGLQAAAAAATGSAAANKFSADMAKLTPQGQELVATVLDMRGAFHLLMDEAQAATLPGFIEMLQNSNAMLPVASAAVRGFGHDLSTTAADFGHLFVDPAFQHAAQQFTNVIVGGFGQFASALPPLLNAIVVDGAKAGPIVDAVAGGVHDLIATGLPDFLSGLTTNASGAGQSLSTIFRVVDDLLGPVGTLTGAFAGALGPALTDLEPDIKMLATDVENDLLPLMPQLSQDLDDVAQIADQVFKIIEPLVPLIAQDLSDALGAIDGPLKDTAGFLHDNADWLKPVAEGVFALVAANKALSIGQSIGKSATDLWKTALTQFSANGTIATAATKAWGVATSDTLAILAKGVGAGGIIISAGIALGDLEAKLSALGRTHLNDSGITQTLLDINQHAPQASGELKKLLDAIEQEPIATYNQNLKATDQALAELVASGHPDQARQALDAITAAMDAQSKGMGENAQKYLPQYDKALTDAANTSRLATGDTTNLKDSTKSAADTADQARQPFSGLALRLGDVAQGGQHGTEELNKLDGALKNIDAQVSKQQAMDEFNKALNDMKDGAAGATRSIQGNSQAAIDNRNQLEQAVLAARHVYDAQINAHVGVDQANASFQAQIDKLKTQAEKTYDSKAAVDHFLDSLGLVPLSKATELTASDKTGLDVIDHFQTALDNIRPGKVNLVVEKILGPGDQEISVIGTKVQARAEGGPIEAGLPYWVGERGPELVIPKAPGTVIPTNEIRQVGGTTPQAAAPPAPAKPAPVITIYFNGQLPTSEQQADMMRQLAAAVAA